MFRECKPQSRRQTAIKRIRDLNLDFRINPYSDPDVCWSLYIDRSYLALVILLNVVEIDQWMTWSLFRNVRVEKSKVIRTQGKINMKININGDFCSNPAHRQNDDRPHWSHSLAPPWHRYYIIGPTLAKIGKFYVAQNSHTSSFINRDKRHVIGTFFQISWELLNVGYTSCSSIAHENALISLTAICRSKNLSGKTLGQSFCIGGSVLRQRKRKGTRRMK